MGQRLEGVAPLDVVERQVERLRLVPERLGHFVGLLTPIWIFDAVGISHGFKQLMAIWVGGIAGIFCLIGIALLTHRRLFDVRSRAKSSFGDIAILLILFA